MAKIIKIITFNFKWSGDCTALRGFNVSLTTQGKTPTEESIITIHIDETEIKPAYSCVLKNITLDSSTIYTAWVQACYPGKDSDWKSSGNLTASDDGSSTIASQTQLNTTNTNVSNVTNKVTNLQQTGLGMKVNFSSFTLVDPGEIYLHGFNPVTGVSEDIDGWVWWNGMKVTIPKGMINPNDFIYNNPIYVVFRTSNSTKYQVAYFTDQKKWKYTTPTKGTVSDWTWNPTTDIILCSFIEPSNEGSLVSSLLYTPPKSPEDVTVSNEINNKIKDVQDNLDNFDSTITGTFRDGIIEEAEAKAIKQNLNIIQTDKAQLDKDYSIVYGNTKLDGTAKTNLNAAKTDYDSKYNTLVSTVNSAIADGKATSSEATAVNNAFTNYKTSIGTLKQRLQEALDYISTKKINDLVIGGRNLLLDSGRVITTTTAYNVVNYRTSSLKPNTKYTFVINGFTNSGNSVGVWFNGGGAGGGTFPETTVAKTQYIVVTTPGTLNNTTVSIFNYPSSTAKNSTINWACMYEGEIKPPLDWSPAPEDINDTISALGEDLQDQIDGKIESYNQTSDPSTAWTTAGIKTQHTGDIWYDDSSKLTQRWSGSAWLPLKDADAIAAQNLAQQKKRVFTATPTTPYDVGDLWVQGGTGDIMKCKTALASGSYNAAHWEKASKYTDDTTANQAVSNTILTPADKISFLATYKDALKANESLSASASLLDLANDPTYKTSYVPAYNVLKALLEALVGDVSKQNSTTTNWDKTGYDSAYDKYVSARENFEKRVKDEIYKYANGEKGVSYENEKLLASWASENNKLLINGGKIYLKSISGESLMMNTITAKNIAIGDFTNYVTANPNYPETTKFSHTPYGEPHISDGYLCKANVTDLYFGLTDTSLNSFTDGDELYFEFTGRAASVTTVTVIVSARDKNASYLFDRQSETITLTTADKLYSGSIKLTGSWTTSVYYNIGISNTAATKVQVFVKNVKVRKKNAGNMIVDGSITSTSLATDAIKSRNYLANSSGMFLNLLNGTIDSKNFKIDASGNLDITGRVIATSGQIGGSDGFNIVNGAIYRGAGVLGQGGSGNIYLGQSGFSIGNKLVYTSSSNTLELNVDGLAIKGYNAATITYVDNGLGNKVNTSWMTQTNIFNKLTNNGATQGIYMNPNDQKIYINAQYIATGILADAAGNISWNLASGVLTAKKLSIDSTNFKLTEAGVVTAKSGIIGGWDITTGSMNRQFTANNKNYWLYFDTGTTSDAYAAFMLRTKATTASAWEDKFSIAWNGKMTAMDADVRGVINATSLQAKDAIQMYSALTAAPATVLQLVKHGSATATYDTLLVGDGLDPNSYLDIQRRTEFAKDVLIKSGDLMVMSNISSSSAYTSNWFRSRGKTGWHSEDYAGGIRMEDASWVRTYGEKNFYCNKNIYAGVNLQVDGTAQIRTINYNGEVNIISRGSQLVKGGADAGGGSWFGSTAIYNRTYTGQSDVCITSSGVVGRRTSSSKRYKKDISYLSHPENSTVKEKARLTRSKSTLRPEAVLNIPVADYKYIEGYVTGGDYEDSPILGFIAEDVEKVFPDAVIYNTIFKDTITNETYEASQLDSLTKIREDLLAQTIEMLTNSYRKEHNLLGSGMIGDPTIMKEIQEEAELLMDKTNPDIASRCVEIVDYSSPERWNEKVIIPAILYVAQQQDQKINELTERVNSLENTLREK